MLHVVGWSLLDCLLFGVCCVFVLLVVRCVLFVASLGLCHVLFIVRCLSFVVWCSLVVVC